MEAKAVVQNERAWIKCALRSFTAAVTISKLKVKSSGQAALSFSFDSCSMSFKAFKEDETLAFITPGKDE